MRIVEAHEAVVERDARANAEDAHATDQRSDVGHVGIAVRVLFVGLFERLVEAKGEYELIDRVRE